MFLHSPLNTRQYRRNIIRRTPPILQNIQTQLARSIHVRVEHGGYELDAGRFVGVLLFEVHYESERAVFEGGVAGSDDDCIPVGAIYQYRGWCVVLGRGFLGVPGHDVVCDGRGADPGGWIGLHAFEVAHQAAAGGGRHGEARGEGGAGAVLLVVFGWEEVCFSIFLNVWA